MSLHSKSKTTIRHLLTRLTQTRPIKTVSFTQINPNPPTQQPKHTAFILHGLLGSSRNWRSFTQSLSSSLSPNPWNFILIDLRNHGNSAFNPDLTPPHNLQSTAEDLVNLIKTNNWDFPDVVIGHSLGGKVALHFAKVCDEKLRQVWVLDSVPGKVVSKGSDEGEVERVLKTLKGLKGEISSRKWLVEHMIGLGFTESLANWIGSNLRNVGGEVKWGFDLDGAVGMFESYREMEYWDVLERAGDGTTEFNLVRAEKSDRWDEGVVSRMEDVAEKSGGRVKVHLLKDAGHWVHVDNPKGLLEIVAPGMASID